MAGFNRKWRSGSGCRALCLFGRVFNVSGVSVSREKFLFLPFQRLVSLFLVSPLLSPAFSQQEVRWLSWERLSVSSSGSYHFRPWHFYNNSLSLVEDAVRYDPTYVNPKGSYEKIVGDMETGLVLSYRLVKGLHLEGAGMYTMTGGSVRLELPRPPFPTSVTTQNLSLRITEWGLGVRSTIALGDEFDLQTSLHVSRASGKVRYEYAYIPSSPQEYLFEADLNDRSTVIRAVVEGGYRLFGPLQITAGVEYRWLRFDNFEGWGNEISRDKGFPYESIRPFQASLGQTDGYFFGLVPLEGSYISNPHLMRTIWNRTEIFPFWWGNLEVKPASLDLSSFGIRIGVRYEFR